MTVSKKIVLFAIGTVVSLTLAFIGIIHFAVTDAFDRLAESDLAEKADNVRSDVKGMEENCLAVAQALAVRADVIQAAKAKNSAPLQTACQEAMKASKMGLITLADAQGVVLARGHSDKKGDSVAAQTNVKKALAGESSSGIEEGTVVKFSLRAGYPIKDGAVVIGSVTAGIDLSASHFFVDSIKSKYKVECTVFQKDNRLITTLQKDGKSLDGTRMDNAKVLETVLAKGQVFESVNAIQNQSFNTVYWPLKGADGQIAGMYFIGKSREHIDRLYRTVMGFGFFASALFSTAALLIGFWIARSIGSSIHAVTSALDTQSQAMFAVAEQITQSSQALAQGASSQAASLEETSASLEEMAATTKRNAEHAAGSKTLAAETSQAVEAGAGGVEEMIQSVDHIRNSSREMGQAMDAVMESNREISKIIKTIDEIAFQTNILALNAAVEAARAGESGLGFAVVADEVRNLAQKSAAAAKETAEKIENALGRSAQGAQVSASLIEKFGGLDAQAKKVGSDFHDIKDRIASMAKSAGDIAIASSEQSQGIEQINKAVAEMDRVTQSNAAHAEESAGAAKELDSQANDLCGSVGEMKKLVTRRSSAAK
jgi:methyl-accepting chemotaxis protein